MTQKSDLRAFNKALLTHLLEYDEMMHARGFSHRKNDPNSIPALFFESLGRLYPGKKVRILLFLFGQGQLHLYLAGPEGVIASEKNSASPRLIQDLINEWKTGLHIYARSAEKAPVLRTSLDLTELSSYRRPEEVQAVLSEYLVPQSIHGYLLETDHLIILPSHSIGTLPFGLLEINGDSLIDYFPISIASDLYDLQESLDQPPKPSTRHTSRFIHPLILGNPQYPQRDGYAFSELPGAEAEARYIHTLLEGPPGTLFTGQEASLSNIQSSLSQADLIFLGTHGVSSPTNSLDESYLVFSDGGGDIQTSFWTAREIQQTKLSADLVVMSACQSGLGVSHEAGIIGLARAFRLAGADHVIMSLWNVNDLATQELMEGLFEILLSSDHPLPAVALREAQLQLRKRWPNPADWAAFSSFGLP